MKKIQEILSKFNKEEWSHWHTKSSSWERLPDSTRSLMSRFLESSLLSIRKETLQEVIRMLPNIIHMGNSMTFDYNLQEFKKFKQQLTNLLDEKENANTK